MSRFHGKYGGNLGFSVRENILRSSKLIPGTSRLTPTQKAEKKQVILSPFFPCLRSFELTTSNRLAATTAFIEQSSFYNDFFILNAFPF